MVPRSLVLETSSNFVPSNNNIKENCYLVKSQNLAFTIVDSNILLLPLPYRYHYTHIVEGSNDQSEDS